MLHLAEVNLTLGRNLIPGRTFSGYTSVSFLKSCDFTNEIIAIIAITLLNIKNWFSKCDH